MRHDPLQELVESGQIAPDWAAALAAVDSEHTLHATLSGLTAFLAEERAGATPVLPEPAQVFRAFERPLSSVRVLIVGQDPYPTPGHPIGLSFATAAHVRPLPRSLRNIYRELADDLGDAAGSFSATGRWDPDEFWAAPDPHGDLTAWADAGVLLLNRVLTVRAGEAGSHRGRGWESFTELAIRALAARGSPLVAILWGNDARKLGPLLGATPCIESAHPSPLSASRGFFGSRPFSRANAELEAQGAAPIDWCAGRP